jgi:hypothetical protein
MIKCGKAQIRQLKTALRWKIPAVQRQRIQMVLLRESGMAQPAIQGDMLAAMQAAALGGFIVGAMSLGLTASRFITERRWLIES